MSGNIVEKNVFRIRLNDLFAASDRRVTNRSVAHGLLADGCRISVPYLSQLRSGARDNPSDEVVAALAKHFGVSVEYFFSIAGRRDRASVQTEDTVILNSIEDSTLKKMMTSVNGLSASSVDILVHMATRLRVFDRIPEIPADSPSYLRRVDGARIPRITHGTP